MSTVLIVDDASFMRNALKFIIEKSGHQVIGMAKDAPEAVHLYKEFKPDLVTLDILLPGASGLSALKDITDEFPDAKVIMVSALGQEQKQEEAKKLGAAGYIRKPFSQDQIVAEVDRVLTQPKAA